jgi:Putative metallopeptidase family (DUF6782)
MLTTPGGSVVDQSLLRQAADRGVTICFADLDGADGLWVPEERTVLVNRGLSDAKVAAVIEHELGHVMIDDQHADLDAGKDVLHGHAPVWTRRRETVALAASVAVVALVGGVMYGINAARGDIKDQVAPNPSGTGLTASEDGTTPAPRVIVTRGPDGVPHTIVITATPPLPTETGSPTERPSATPTVTKPAPTRVPSTSGSAPIPPPTTPAPAPPPPTTDPSVAPTTPPDPTTVPPSSPAVETPGGAGETGGGAGSTDSAPVGTDPTTGTDATLVDAPAANPPAADGPAANPSAAGPSDVVPVEGASGS